jgi:hypothetical protein
VNQLIELLDLIAELDGERIVLKLAGVSYSLHSGVTFPACCLAAPLKFTTSSIRNCESWSEFARPDGSPL